jgi:hypothetical protein
MYSIKHIERHFPFRIQILRTDVEGTLGSDIASKLSQFQLFIQESGISWEPSAPYTKQQNGAAERAGKSIIEKARMLRVEAKFPKRLWPEIVKAVADMLNLTPTKSINWDSPLGMLYKALDPPRALPTLAHLRAYGSLTYVRNPKISKGDKLKDRSIKGYLIGYDSSNIYHVWV